MAGTHVEGLFRSPCHPSDQRKPPSQTQSSEWVDMVRGPFQECGERVGWALDTIQLPAEEISKSLAKGHQLLGAWILTTPDSGAFLSRVPGHRESKMHQILRSCRLVGRQATQESKETL